jgi:hypothetical protein
LLAGSRVGGFVVLRKGFRRDRFGKVLLPKEAKALDGLELSETSLALRVIHRLRLTNYREEL